MIKKYPAFSKLKISHKAEIDEFSKNFPPYSDFNFTSLFTWDADDLTKVSLLNDNLVIKLPHYASGKLMTSLLGENKIDNSLAKLLADSDKLEMVPETTVQAIKDPTRFKVEEDFNNHDYIYNLADFMKLEGDRYKKIRHKLNAFQRQQTTNLQINHFKVPTHHQAEQILVLFEEWAQIAHQSPADSATESIMLKRLLSHAASLDLLFITIGLEDKIIGCSIQEILSSDYAIAHLEKASHVPAYTPTFLAYKAAEKLLDYECKYLNWEQDLGIERLKKSKLAYRPEFFLKKYTVTSKV